MKSNEMRERLMDAAIEGTASLGIEGVSAAHIALATGFNESYIYRYFLNVDELLKATFSREDVRLINILNDNFEIIYDLNLSVEERFRKIFDMYLDYLDQNTPNCVFYATYYLTNSRMKYSYHDHLHNFSILLDNFSNILIPGTDTFAVLHVLFDIFVGSVWKVYNKDLPNKKETYDDTFNQIVETIKGYMLSDDDIVKKQYKSNDNEEEEF